MGVVGIHEDNHLVIATDTCISGEGADGGVVKDDGSGQMRKVWSPVPGVLVGGFSRHGLRATQVVQAMDWPEPEGGDLGPWLRETVVPSIFERLEQAGSLVHLDGIPRGLLLLVGTPSRGLWYVCEDGGVLDPGAHRHHVVGRGQREAGGFLAGLELAGLWDALSAEDKACSALAAAAQSHPAVAYEVEIHTLTPSGSALERRPLAALTPLRRHDGTVARWGLLEPTAVNDDLVAAMAG